ncbi:MAG TPA: recombinase family protein [Pirellulales bacterium]|nr:recombinase family protein [Pirellulales bacterium]
MKLVGYARTSTTEQVAGLEAQIRDLTAAGAEIIYNEQVSSVGERPEFEAALATLEAGDTLVVTKMDRLARSIVDLLNLVENFNKSGFTLRILNLGGDTVDTRSATGRLMLSMLASFAQFEREIMLERQRDGIAKAKSEGKYRGGAPTARRKSAQVLEMRNEGKTLSEIARALGVSRASVGRILERNGLQGGWLKKTPQNLTGDDLFG